MPHLVVREDVEHNKTAKVSNWTRWLDITGGRDGLGPICWFNVDFHAVNCPRLGVLVWVPSLSLWLRGMSSRLEFWPTSSRSFVYHVLLISLVKRTFSPNQQRQIQIKEESSWVRSCSDSSPLLLWYRCWLRLGTSQQTLQTQERPISVGLQFVTRASYIIG